MEQQIPERFRLPQKSMLFAVRLRGAVHPFWVRRVRAADIPFGGARRQVGRDGSVVGRRFTSKAARRLSVQNLSEGGPTSLILKMQCAAIWCMLPRVAGAPRGRTGAGA